MNTLLIILFAVFNCSREVPTQFSEAAMNDTFIALDGSEIQFKNILSLYKGKQIVIDIWASWCGDCIKGMPKLRELQRQFPETTYLFLSLDKNKNSWKRGIKAYNVKGQHYYMQSGWEGAFGKFVDIDWIPRYMVVDSNGNIKLFKATKSTDKAIVNALK